ncbi:putative DNA-binding protein [Virgibacillus senegalensis]|uniref:putative DNA-binding protein n=1 Tax=Virgibacillus senegalensis TaxID=1499679 RepID=UPI00069F00F1|nr:putative DNA-binding protein [Virgibacillus senegalensis]
MLEKTTRINFLFDFYQELLTPKQRNYMELYYLEDYSLGEISETFDVSRQAVYDNIRRTEAMLEAYEDKLHLYKKFTARTDLLEQMGRALKENQTSTLRELVDSLKELD